MDRQQKWPTHGTAVNARDDAAILVNTTEQRLAMLLRLVRKGDAGREETAYWLAESIRDLNHVMRILEAQGAPTQPLRANDK